MREVMSPYIRSVSERGRGRRNKRNRRGGRGVRWRRRRNRKRRVRFGRGSRRSSERERGGDEGRGDHVREWR
jgi:hypothetical protein